MTGHYRCPQCGNQDVSIREATGTLTCHGEGCGYQGPIPVPPALPLKGSADEDRPLHERARRLAQAFHTGARLGDLLPRWPSPIAHELDMLHRLLDQGEIVGAFYQLRDVAEVLIKLPAVILARDLIEHGAAIPIPAANGEPAPDYIRRTLLAKSPSAGTWRTLACDLAQALCPNLPAGPPGLVAPGLVRLFYCAPDGRRADRPEPTALFKALEALVAWRNQAVGHGGFRPDFSEHLDSLEHMLIDRGGAKGLDRALAAALEADPWQGLVLRILDGDGDGDGNGDGEAPGHPLIGSEAIRPGHRGQGHVPKDAPLVLAGPVGRLDLGPYAAARRCDLCSHQDVFLYNGFSGKRDRPANNCYQFLDYRTAHPMERRWNQARDLVAERTLVPGQPDSPLPQVEGEGPADRPPGPGQPQAVSFNRLDIVQLLDAIAVERRFLPPEYLNAALRAFLGRHPRGVLWLSAPAHVGKSLFVLALDQGWDYGGEDHPLSPARTGRALQVPVASFAIRREYRYGPGPFRDQLRLSLARALNLAAEGDQQSGLPILDLEAADKPAAFADWIGDFRRRSPLGLGPGDPFLICLDGLDELPAPVPGEASILDFLPAPSALPADTYLLLTSRPRDGADDACPPWVWERVQRTLAGQPGFESLAIGLGDGDYLGLLRDYLRRELAASLVVGIAPAMARWLAGGVQPECDGDAPIARALLALRDSAGERIGPRLELAWYNAQPPVAPGTAGAERNPKTPPSPPPLPPALLAAQSRALDGLFETLLDKADGRFLYLALLVDRLAERDLSLEDIPALAAGERLHLDYLDTWNDRLLPKQADLGKRVLLLLAAAEQVHDCYRARPGGTETADPIATACRPLDLPPQETVFHGLPLDLLLALLHGTEAGEGSTQPLPAPALVYVLYRLKPVLGSWRGEAASHSRFRIGLKGLTQAIATHPDWRDDLQRTHRRLAADVGALLDDAQAQGVDTYAPSAGDLYLLQAALGHARLAADGGELERRLASHPCTLPLLRRQAETDDNALATDHRRAIDWLTLALAWQGDLGGADESIEVRYGRAVDWFHRGLHRYQQGGDLAGAVTDYDVAITIMEGIRDLALAKGGDDGWPLPLRNVLAGTYQNRGLVRVRGGDLLGAVADYDAAIALHQGIRDLTRSRGGEEGWALPLRTDLALVYQNRGNARLLNSNLAEAIADCDAAIAIIEGVRDLTRAQGGEDAWALPLRNLLAGTYQNRGLARADGGDLAGAVADYDVATAIMEDIRDLVCAQGGEDAWTLPLRNDLAAVYQNRGLARADGGDLLGAVVDHAAAIALREGIRDLARGRGGEDGWAIPLRNNLAGSYQNRGNARLQGGDLAGAVADYDAAIAIMEALRDLGRARGGEDAWALPLRNDLAMVFQNRGNARLQGGDLAGAVADYDAAIAIREGIRDRARGGGGEDAWALPMRNSLATVYQNRGLARAARGDLARAVTDYDAAIAITEGIRDLVSAKEGEVAWALPLRNDLARVYTNRGEARRLGGDLAGGVADYDAAIALREAIRDLARARDGEDGWSRPLRNELATVYQSRGNARLQGGDLAGAVKDCDSAIALREGIRDLARAQGGEDGWALPLRDDLATACQNRGLARAQGGDLAGAIADYDAAIAILDGIRDRTRAQGGEDAWSPPLRNGLARVYQNRGNARLGGNDLAGAVIDYDAAIVLMEGIRDLARARGGDDAWALPLRDDLARTYHNRGGARTQGGDPAEALADYDVVIAIREGIRDLARARGGESAWLAAARFDLAKALLARAQVQGRERRRADLAAARAIADGLATLGYQDLAQSLRAACAMAALPRPILWLLGRVIGPVAKRFAGLFLRLQAKALTPPGRDR